MFASAQKESCLFQAKIVQYQQLKCQAVRTWQKNMVFEIVRSFNVKNKAEEEENKRKIIVAF